MLSSNLSSEQWLNKKISCFFFVGINTEPPEKQIDFQCVNNKTDSDETSYSTYTYY